MNRRAVTTLIALAIVASLAWTLWIDTDPVLRTADEIAVEIAAQPKTARTARIVRRRWGFGTDIISEVLYYQKYRTTCDD